jgi:catechol 2,3-dioxygenase-like lactoylglutathione lyase family enzyme
MIQRLSHTTLYVLDQDDAKAFYTEKLGFVVRMDFRMDNGFRWLTVSPEAQPDMHIILMQVDGALKSLLEAGRLGGIVLQADDCRKTHEDLAARGVHFLAQPEDKFYGIEPYSATTPATGSASLSPRARKAYRRTRTNLAPCAGAATLHDPAPSLSSGECVHQSRMLVGASLNPVLAQSTGTCASASPRLNTAIAYELVPTHRRRLRERPFDFTLCSAGSGSRTGIARSPSGARLDFVHFGSRSGLGGVPTLTRGVVLVQVQGLL